MGGRICEHQELAYSCLHRTELGMSFPDNTWLHTGTVMIRSLGGGSTSNFVAYAVYRRYGDRCFGPQTINPNDAVIGYDLAETVRNYACCVDHRF